MADEAENGEMPLPGDTVSSPERPRGEAAPRLRPETSAPVDLSHGESRVAVTLVKPPVRTAGPTGASVIADHGGRYHSLVRSCRELGSLIRRYRPAVPGALLKGRLRGQASRSAALSRGENFGAVTADRAAIATARQAAPGWSRIFREATTRSFAPARAFSIS